MARLYPDNYNRHKGTLMNPTHDAPVKNPVSGWYQESTYPLPPPPPRAYRVPPAPSYGSQRESRQADLCNGNRAAPPWGGPRVAYLFHIGLLPSDAGIPGRYTLHRRLVTDAADAVWRASKKLTYIEESGFVTEAHELLYAKGTAKDMELCKIAADLRDMPRMFNERIMQLLRRKAA